MDEPIEMAKRAKKQDYGLMADLIVYFINQKINANDVKSAWFDEELYMNSLQNDLKLKQKVKVEVIKEPLKDIQFGCQN
ncbi:hypothetical protein [Echinicola shivajiensis]|uniref:hypothetical protein n=1 Tax=Echinicola shivajiensis TaxID=1035916 RepID=UPI001BFCCE38|nr:hypothetical protein [Echinicola shivajiensis]